MEIITSGKKYIDIDAFACIYAYKELLDMLGIENKAIVTVSLNYSISEKYKKLNFFDTNYGIINKFENISYTIMDVSDPLYFEKFVNKNKVKKIFDHHPGFIDYWREKIGEDAIIENIGAAATLIFLEYKKNNLLHKISKISAELLAVAIIGNTLNFQSAISQDIDKEAYEELKKYFEWTPDFENNYFKEVQENIENDILKSLNEDSKSVQIGEKTFFISQLEVIDSKSIIIKYFMLINDFLSKKKEDICFLNLIDLKGNYNYIFFKDKGSMDYFCLFFKDFTYEYDKNMAKSKNVILRKEILSNFYSSLSF